MKTKIKLLLTLFTLLTTPLIKGQEKLNLEKELKPYTSTGYFLFLKKECDLNMDKKTDYIVILKPKKKKNKEEEVIYVCVLINETNAYKLSECGGIISPPNTNSLAEGFQNLVVKNNYFTFEQQSAIGQDFFENEDTTFKYDITKKKIYLHKFSISRLHTNSKKDFTKIYTKKNFGDIEFFNFEMSELKDILN
ncbi:hypothetical protein [Flavobacterium columnare]|uniref:hypothetical protein n=1 Tax=Flavobacterium columnare TaxID=996 RepID=UPI00107EDC2A|nr:hypothetical protein [Flavobacterium columnare]MCH4829851.1 hypothetical protein [Flavobacterium columnare]MCH4832769.1 hypothetical protein [Flavobacterium columnare]